MAHVRQQIREAVATAITGLASAASVHQSRVYDLEAGDLPAFKVYTLSEGSERDSLSYPRGTRRQLQVVVEAAAKAAADLDDTLDTLCAEVNRYCSRYQPGRLIARRLPGNHADRI